MKSVLNKIDIARIFHGLFDYELNYMFLYIKLE